MPKNIQHQRQFQSFMFLSQEHGTSKWKDTALLNSPTFVVSGIRILLAHESVFLPRPVCHPSNGPPEALCFWAVHLRVHVQPAWRWMVSRQTSAQPTNPGSAEIWLRKKLLQLHSKRQWVAVALAEPYASLHLTLQARCPSCRPTNRIKALEKMA